MSNNSSNTTDKNNQFFNLPANSYFPPAYYNKDLKTIINEQIIPMFMQMQYDKSFIKKIFTTLSSVCLIILINYLFDKYTHIFSYLASYYEPLFYKIKTFSEKELKKIEPSFFEKLNLSLSNDNKLQIFRPFYTTKVKLIKNHLKEIELKEQIDAENKLLEMKKKEYKLLKYDNTLVEITPKKLFDSNNYQKLLRSVRLFFEIGNRTGNFLTVPYLLWGAAWFGQN